MNLPWATILKGDDVIKPGDYTTQKSLFWEYGWISVDDVAFWDTHGLTVAEANAPDIDGGERVWIRPKA
jgi:hypothetical protein